MVNNSIQTAIPLIGPGYRPRRNGEYQQGEFRRLTNVEVAGDRLRNRRSIHSVYGDSAENVVTPMANPLGFIGTMGTFSLIVNNTEQKAVGPDGVYTLWAPTSLSVPVAANSFNKLIGFFQYNNKNYWLTLKFDAGNNIKITMLHGNIVDGNDHPVSYGAGYFASLTAVDLLTIPAASLDYNKFIFRNFFLQGERLWLVTTAGVYFSKATDPTIFAVPDGGFFKFPDQTVTWGMSVRNNLYVLCDNTVHHITYNTNPNTDATVRRLSDNLGGEMGVIHQDTPYLINNIGVYRINNGYLEKVLDNELDLGQDYYNNSIKSFGEYLILGKRSPVNYEKFDSTSTQQRVNLVRNPSLETNTTGYNLGSQFCTLTRDVAKGFSRASSLKAVKKNDLTQVNRTNRVTNPTFEVNTAGWHLLTDGIADGETLTRVLDAGSWRGRVAWTAGGVAGGGRPSTYGSITLRSAAFLPCVAGAEYFVEFSVKKESAVVSAIAGVEWYDSGNNLISTDSGESVTLSTSYKAVGLFTTAPVGAVSFKSKLFVQGTSFAPGSMFVDACYAGEPRSTGNVANYFNGSNPAVGSQYSYAWTGAAHESTSVEMGLVGTNPIICDYGDAVNTIVVAAGVSYRIGAAVWTDEPRRVKCRVYTFNGGGALIGTTQIDPGVDTEADAWKYLLFSYTAPTGAARIEIELYINGTTMAYTEEAWVDALIVERTDTYTGYFDGESTDTTAATFAWSGAADASTSTGTASAIPRRLYQAGYAFSPGAAGNILGYNVFALNTETGALHVIGFTDCRDTPSQRGYIVDMLVNYNKDKTGNYNLFFLTNRFESETSASYTYSSNAYYMNTSYDLDFFDYAATSAEVTKKYAPKVEIEIENFIPSYVSSQGFSPNSYVTKKMRLLEFIGRVPRNNFLIQVAYENQPYTDVPVQDVTSGDPDLARPHWPYRIPLMQRARTISILFKNENSDNPLYLDDPYGQLELSAAHILWAQTYRRPNQRAVIK